VTSQQEEAFCHALLGTADSPEKVAEKLDLPYDSVEELETIASDANLEQCSECEWWVEAGELVDEDGEVTVCSSCQRRGELARPGESL
jgi:DNA-directed RNA polymerase sigma subunit (sigma70/sigma32)